MGRLIQWLLDKFYISRKGAMAGFAYLSLRLYGLEVAAKDVWKGTYSERKLLNREFEITTALPELLATAKDCVRRAREQRAAIIDKCKTLLTVSSLLLCAIGLFLPKSFLFEPLWSRTLFFVAMGALLSTVTLLLVFFDVGQETEITLDKADVKLGLDDLRKNLINDNLRCQTDIENRTAYLVDIYKAARFYFLLALTLNVAVLFFSVNYLAHSPTNLTEKVIKRIRTDQKLFELLQGPAGSRGEKGERGEKGTVDTDKIIEQLISDPRVQAIIENSNETGEE